MQCRFSDDPVYMPLGVQRDEYIKSDYGLVFMGSHQNISRRPWLYGQVGRLEQLFRTRGGVIHNGSNVHLNVCARVCFQYEPGVLEACLQLLQVSPQHLSDPRKDYILRADPVYISRVICAMVRNHSRRRCLHVQRSVRLHSGSERHRFLSKLLKVIGRIFSKIAMRNTAEWHLKREMQPSGSSVQS